MTNKPGTLKEKSTINQYGNYMAKQYIHENWQLLHLPLINLFLLEIFGRSWGEQLTLFPYLSRMSLGRHQKCDSGCTGGWVPEAQGRRGAPAPEARGHRGSPAPAARGHRGALDWLLLSLYYSHKHNTCLEHITILWNHLQFILYLVMDNQGLKYLLITVLKLTIFTSFQTFFYEWRSM